MARHKLLTPIRKHVDILESVLGQNCIEGKKKSVIVQ